jgi:hypothetical protein
MELAFGDQLIMQSCGQGVGYFMEKFVGKDLKEVPR